MFTATSRRAVVVLLVTAGVWLPSLEQAVGEGFTIRIVGGCESPSRSTQIFSPEGDTPPLAVPATVTFVNDDSCSHRVTARAEHGGPQGNIASGASEVWTVETVGRLQFWDSAAPFRGYAIVTVDPPPPPPPPSPTLTPVPSPTATPTHSPTHSPTPTPTPTSPPSQTSTTESQSSSLAAAGPPSAAPRGTAVSAPAVPTPRASAPPVARAAPSTSAAPAASRTATPLARRTASASRPADSGGRSQSAQVVLFLSAGAALAFGIAGGLSLRRRRVG